MIYETMDVTPDGKADSKPLVSGESRQVRRARARNYKKALGKYERMTKEQKEAVRERVEHFVRQKEELPQNRKEP